MYRVANNGGTLAQIETAIIARAPSCRAPRDERPCAEDGAVMFFRSAIRRSRHSAWSGGSRGCITSIAVWTPPGQKGVEPVWPTLNAAEASGSRKTCTMILPSSGVAGTIAELMDESIKHQKPGEDVDIGVRDGWRSLRQQMHKIPSQRYEASATWVLPELGDSVTANCFVKFHVVEIQFPFGAMIREGAAPIDSSVYERLVQDDCCKTDSRKRTDLCKAESR
ncbi:hypothetical protein DFH09DRAFT_1094348 [Mycena vulgaris]|nr:hypothetical protein DFH09DRAFT_1094348 [Mycena vulgaris]